MLKTLIIALCVLAVLVGLWFALTQPTFSSSPPTDSVAVDMTRLQAHVRALCETYFPRDAGHPENLDRAARYIREAFEQAGGITSEQAYEVDGVTYRNVIALFGPDTRERIVVGAHYDAFSEFPGADDNASGVAGLIELAHLLGNKPLAMTMELVAFTLEEPPAFRTWRMGSAVHADALKQKGTKVRIMFALEMIGFFNDAKDSQSFPVPGLGLFYPSQGDFIAVVGRLGQGSAVRRAKKAMRSASPLPVYSINAPRFIAGVDFSDHRNYWDAGYTALMITDTAFYRNPAYHTARDTPDTLDYERMAMVVQGVYQAVIALAH